MQYAQIPKLYERRQYIDDPMVEVLAKTQGPVRLKKEKSLLGHLKNPGSLKYFFKFHSKGRLLVGYDDVPPTPESRPKTVVVMQDVKEVQENPDGKKNHLRVSLAEESLTLKFDSPAEMGNWAKAINHLRNYYKSDKPTRARGFKEEVDMETCLEIMAENEIARWPTEKEKYDYTLFFKDKGLLEMFGQLPIAQLSNRILVGPIQKKTRKVKGDPVTQSTVSVSRSPNVSKVTMSVEPPSPSDVGKRHNKTFFEKIDNLGFRSYIGFLISQSPVNAIDEEAFNKDHRALPKPECLRKYEYNTLYLFEYSGAGDTRPFKKDFAVRWGNQGHAHHQRHLRVQRPGADPPH